MSLEGDFSSFDTIDEKEVTYGAAAIDIDYDPIAAATFSPRFLFLLKLWDPSSSFLCGLIVKGFAPSSISVRFEVECPLFCLPHSV